MRNSLRAITFPAFAVALAAASALAGGPAWADDAMKADPMAADSMKADCMAKAAAETDAMKKQDMTAECDKTGTSAMGTDAMKSDPMATDAMAAPKQ